MPRERNTLLEGVLHQLGWSQATTARHLQRVAAEVGAEELKAVSASHVNQWVRGSHPASPATRILCRPGRRGRSTGNDTTALPARTAPRRCRRPVALVAYLRTDVASYLGGRFPDQHTRKEMFTAAGELAYLAGWTAFDSSEHALAQQWLDVALRLSAEADDAPLAGHILRAQAHQTLDLGHPALALQLAEASVAHRRYTDASPRERSLLGVVHARSLAAAGHKQQAIDALLRAEDDLRHAERGDEEPARVFFFSEASLAHETARTLQVLGDIRGAECEFQRSVRTRRAQPFARTHAVTLGLLGAVQIQRGAVDAACATWSQALDTMQGVQSGRALDTVVLMRRSLSPYRGRGGTALAQLDDRARTVIGRVR